MQSKIAAKCQGLNERRNETVAISRQKSHLHLSFLIFPLRQNLQCRKSSDRELHKRNLNCRPDRFSEGKKTTHGKWLKPRKIIIVPNLCKTFRADLLRVLLTKIWFISSVSSLFRSMCASAVCFLGFRSFAHFFCLWKRFVDLRFLVRPLTHSCANICLFNSLYKLIFRTRLLVALALIVCGNKNPWCANRKLIFPFTSRRNAARRKQPLVTRSPSCIQTVSVSLSFYHTRPNQQTTLNYVFTLFVVKTFTKRKRLCILSEGIKINMRECLLMTAAASKTRRNVYLIFSLHRKLMFVMLE